jgi:putative ABC transport system ATP-binding protein
VENKPLLRLVKVKKDYLLGELVYTALNEIDISFFKGEFVVILGASGSGKSTMLNLIGGIDKITAGDIFFNDKNIRTFNSHELTDYRRNHAGFIFQFYNLISNLTVKENIELATQISRRPLDIREIASLIGLEDYLSHFPSQLSGGQQQRVAIARAVSKNPEVLLCDEPTGALDSATGKLVLKLLREVNKMTHNTTIVVTHNADIAKMADRVVRMKDGRITEEKIIDEPLAPEQIEW